ncbi:hypothetical protein BDQ12DRAFT_679338 [Crucibulum laeve]|uniref:Uncharacterized protein n=1 Tax=Crucibulum laeve TaxID=68775 RepID=A0A5C3M7V0_9AGAR|nr:hypothetical protein BDQ12DRAFT_679338 [Crucibulum laeve]
MKWGPCPTTASPSFEPPHYCKHACSQQLMASILDIIPQPRHPHNPLQSPLFLLYIPIRIDLAVIAHPLIVVVIFHHITQFYLHPRILLNFTCAVRIAL